MPLLEAVLNWRGTDIKDISTLRRYATEQKINMPPPPYYSSLSNHSGSAIKLAFSQLLKILVMYQSPLRTLK